MHVEISERKIKGQIKGPADLFYIQSATGYCGFKQRKGELYATKSIYIFRGSYASVGGIRRRGQLE